MTSKIVVNNIEADAGVSTVTFNSNVERGSSNLHSTGLNVNDTFVHSTGIALGAGSTVGAVTGVTTYYGDGSQLTGISAGTSLSGSTNDTICTVTGANAIQGEANLTFTGSQLNVTGNISLPDSAAPDYVGNIYVGSGSDLKIFHNGTDNFIRSGAGNANIRIDNNAGVLGARFIPAGSSELYHNGRLRAYTVSNAFYVEQAELNDDCSILINNKSTTISSNQKTTLVCRVERLSLIHI